MLRNALRTALVTAVLLAAFYALDWAFWRVRVSRGAGMGEVEVSHVSIASLKGNKEEYYSDGTSIAACSRSLFPMRLEGVGIPPCWWLRKHTQIVEQD